MRRTPKSLKRALKHQKRLSLLKLFILAGVVLTVFLILLMSYYFNHKNSSLQENKKNESSKEITERQILEPHFEGVDEKNQPYHVKAQYATQTSEEQVDLNYPEGELLLTNGEKLEIRANAGVLTDQNKRLDLEGDVKLNYAHCRVVTHEAHANLETKKIEGGEVHSLCPEGVIKAGAFSVDHNQGIVTYKKRPHLVLYENVKKPSSQ
ncbi:MAG: LPS export ABC transporter periplasmic protein LptC [Proteobacteria bacterium]|nr:LPS export ABC transporter periplasmic protein LptC [Pseudomonadota bacterium]